MTEIKKLSPSFIKQLETDGFNLKLVFEAVNETKDTVKILRQITGYSSDKILAGLGQTAQNKSRSKEKSNPISDNWNLLTKLGADPNAIPKILCVEKAFTEAEFYRSLNNRTAFLERLAEMSVGRPVPMPVFNCFSFNWAPQKNSHPICTIYSNIDTAISLYYQSRLNEVASLLAQVGQADISLIVPDSEALDERLWPFNQNQGQRISMVEETKSNLSKRSAYPVFTWNEFCQLYNLDSPENYTLNNYQRITVSEELTDIVKQSLPKEREYFANYLGKNQAQAIPEDILLEKILWYRSMYAGEGQALAQAGAMVLNFEEATVPRWFQIGANNQLAIITPVKDVNMYYAWKNEKVRNKNL